MKNRILSTALVLSGLTVTLGASASDQYFTFCNETTHQAFLDPALRIPDGRVHSTQICGLPTATADKDPNTRRCVNAQKSKCQFAAGGEGATDEDDPHNVPSGAYYQADGVGAYTKIRCICGCFPGDTRMLTSRGWSPVAELAASTTTAPFAVAVASGATSGLAMAPQAAGRDFVVGPEDKPVVTLATAHGETLTLTENHPVLLATDRGPDMVQAKAVKVGDRVVTTDGAPTAVTRVSVGRLPAGANTVYNVDSRQDEMGSRIVQVNGLRMGDVVWQNRLSSLQGRVAALLK